MVPEAMAGPRYHLRDRVKRDKRGSKDMEPPVDSSRPNKCVLYDPFPSSSHPELTPSGQKISVITFQQLPAAEGDDGRTCAYRAFSIPKAGPSTSNSQAISGDDGTDRPTSEFGNQDANMETDELFDYL